MAQQDGVHGVENGLGGGGSRMTKGLRPRHELFSEHEKGYERALKPGPSGVGLPRPLPLEVCPPLTGQLLWDSAAN